VSAGLIIDGCIHNTLSGYETEAMDGRALLTYPYGTGLQPSGFRVSIGGGQAVTAVVTAAKVGTKARTFSDDWYNRIHVTPNQLNVGNLLSLQVKDITVWNAYFTPKTLDSVTGVADAGISLVQPEEAPIAYAPLQAMIYQLRVDISGPPVVTGGFQFTFGSEVLTLTVSGNRIVVWPYIPQHGVTEALEWKTDIIRAKAGEQRIALRDAPRQTLSYRYFMNDTEVSKARAISYGWAHRIYGVPVWTECTFIGAVEEGTNSLSVDTTNCDYRVGESVVVWEAYDKYEAVSVTAVTAGSLTLDVPLNLSYSGAYVAPMRYARSSGLGLKRGPHHMIEADIDFQSTVNKDLSASMGLPQHQSIDVLTDTMHFLGAFDERVERDITVIDNGIGTVFVDALYNETRENFTVSWAFTNRADLRRVKSWLHQLKGKWKTFWLPTKSIDLELNLDASSSSLSIDVKSINWELYYGTRAIQIVRKNGVKTFHSVTGGMTNGAVDTLSLAASVGVNTLVTDVAYISFMYLVRLDADRIEIAYEDNGYATIKIPVVEVVR